MNIKTIIKTIILGVILFLAIDFMCLCAWAYSGQVPQDNFFAGAISYNIIKVIQNL